MQIHFLSVVVYGTTFLCVYLISPTSKFGFVGGEFAGKTENYKTEVVFLQSSIDSVSLCDLLKLAPFC